MARAAATSMKALVFTGPGTVEVLDVPEPEVADGEVLVHVRSAVTRAQTIRHQRPGGVAAWLGLAEQITGIDGAALVRAENRVLGSFAYHDEEFSQAAELLGHWDLSWASGFPLTAGAEIFTALMNGEPNPVKAVLKP
jgi:threonine dehydrogenase-like Zn-dependent dehydrogenase